jgi:hypothetical protein
MRSSCDTCCRPTNCGQLICSRCAVKTPEGLAEKRQVARDYQRVKRLEHKLAAVALKQLLLDLANAEQAGEISDLEKMGTAITSC